MLLELTGTKSCFTHLTQQKLTAIFNHHHSEPTVLVQGSVGEQVTPILLLSGPERSIVTIGIDWSPAICEASLSNV